MLLEVRARCSQVTQEFPAHWAVVHYSVASKALGVLIMLARQVLAHHTGLGNQLPQVSSSVQVLL